MSFISSSDSQPLNIPTRRRALSVGSSLGRQSFSHITCNPSINPNIMDAYHEKSGPLAGNTSPQNSPPSNNISGYLQLINASSFPKSNQILDAACLIDAKSHLPHARIQALKDAKETPDRPASPMRSMILNGQFLD